MPEIPVSDLGRSEECFSIENRAHFALLSLFLLTEIRLVFDWFLDRIRVNFASFVIVKENSSRFVCFHSMKFRQKRYEIHSIITKHLFEKIAFSSVFQAKCDNFRAIRPNIGVNPHRTPCDKVSIHIVMPTFVHEVLEIPRLVVRRANEVGLIHHHLHAPGRIHLSEDPPEGAGKLHGLIEERLSVTRPVRANHDSE
jgi:hypothetical protein